MIHDLATAAGLAFFLFGLFVFFSAVLGLLHGWSLSAAKTLLVFVFLWLTSPVASHLIAEMEVATVPDVEKECEVEER